LGYLSNIPRQLDERPSFSAHIRTIRHVVLNVRPLRKISSPLMFHDRDPAPNLHDMRFIARLPEIAHRTLTPCEVRIHLDGFVVFSPERWTTATELLGAFLEGVETWCRVWTSASASAIVSERCKAPVIRIACSEEDFGRKRAQALAKNISKNYDSVVVSWVRTGECRYQGPIGDIVVKWKEDMQDGHQQLPSSSSAGLPSQHDHLRSTLMDNQLYAHAS
jgi:hypothetical protein